jgi:hypothetical protein
MHAVHVGKQGICMYALEAGIGMMYDVRHRRHARDVCMLRKQMDAHVDAHTCTLSVRMSVKLGHMNACMSMMLERMNACMSVMVERMNGCMSVMLGRMNGCMSVVLGHMNACMSVMLERMNACMSVMLEHMNGCMRSCGFRWICTKKNAG